MATSQGWCGDDRWGPINSSGNDLTNCFQTTIIQSAVPAYMATVGLYHFFSLRNSFMPYNTRKLKVILRELSSASLIVVPLILLFIGLSGFEPSSQSGESFFTLNPYRTFALLTHSLSWALATALLSMENSRLLPISWNIRVFWCISFLCYAKQFHAGLVALSDSSSAFGFFLATALLASFSSVLLVYAVLQRKPRPPSVDFNEKLIPANVEVHIKDESALWDSWMGFQANKDSQPSSPDANTPKPLDSNVSFSSHASVLTQSYESKQDNVILSPAGPLSPPKEIAVNVQKEPAILDLTIGSYSSFEFLSSSITKYGIKVKSPGYEGYIVQRSYSDFLAFHEKVSKTAKHNGIQMPLLPPEPEKPDNEHLKVELENYLRKLTDFVQLSAELEEFIELSKATKKAPTKSHSKRFSHFDSEAVTSPNSDIPSSLEQSPDRSPEKPRASTVEEKKAPTPVKEPQKAVAWNIISVSFSGWSKWVSKKKNKEFETFNIVAHCVDGPIKSERPFSEIRNMRKILREKFPKARIPRLFTKAEWEKEPKTTDFLDRALVLFDLYLKRVASISSIRCEELYSFLTNPKFHPQAPEKLARISVSEPNVSPKKEDLVSDDDLSTESATIVDSKNVVQLGDSAPEMHRFQVMVPSYSRADQNNPKSHVLYDVCIREYYSVSDYLEWKVSRRFSEFEKLYNSMKKSFQDVPFPELPSKIQLQRENEQFFHDRMESLLHFLEQIIGVRYYHCDELFAFIEINNPNRAITFGSTEAKAAP